MGGLAASYERAVGAERLATGWPLKDPLAHDVKLHRTTVQATITLHVAYRDGNPLRPLSYSFASHARIDRPRSPIPPWFSMAILSIEPNCDDCLPVPSMYVDSRDPRAPSKVNLEGRLIRHAKRSGS
jgi:hypothetical protein